MRYLIESSMEKDIVGRQKYIRNCMQLWCSVSKPGDGFIHLTGIPAKKPDILFIVGHDISVLNYLKTNDIPESTIVAITCKKIFDIVKFKKQGKTIYFPFQDTEGYEGYALLLEGSLFGFEFDLTESERLFYNSKKIKEMTARLEKCFIKG